MKETVWKMALAAALAGFSAYSGQLLVPVCVLLAAMALDYISGLVRAWETGTLSSRTGILGIAKKAGYLLVVCVGTVTDWVIHEALLKIGVTGWTGCFTGLLVVIWLILNELLSILENAVQIGVPVPAFLGKLVSRLRITVEEKGEVQ